ncbi:MAG: PTS sugar transporter subunit IIA [Silvania sp.]|uniref:PTS sugar transporter subunit IIA n=1 Tax=Silvania sp. TaxID=3016633 RepID=UPI003EE6D028
MLGWVITCHDEHAQKMADQLAVRFGPLVQCQVVNYWRGLSCNMLSRMMCDAQHQADSGNGVIFLTDIAGAAPYRAAALLSHKHDKREVISGISYPLLESLYPLRDLTDSVGFRNTIVARGAPDVSSLWHQQQKNPPFVLHYPL